MHLPPLIQDLAVILGVGGVVAALFQRLRQPAILGYLIAGVAVGWLARDTGIIRDRPNIQTWADIGVIFLMFSIGLEFSFRKLLRAGGAATLAAILEVSTMLALGYCVGRLLGWSERDSIFLGGMVSIASTTIILKSLEELGLKSRRFAQLIFGMLIVEDLLAIFLLVVLGNLASNHVLEGMDYLHFGGRLVLVVGTWFLVGYFVIPRFMRSAGRKSSDETVLLLSIGLCLCLAAVAAHFQYSVALGAFIMGSILAESSESHRIEELLKPLRDLFGAIFFVSVGMLLDPTTLLEHWGLTLAVSAAVVFGKSVIVTGAALVTGQTFRTAAQAGMGMAQIGEFSFIIAGYAAASSGNSRLQAVAITVSVLTSFTTPYFIRNSHRVAVKVESILPLRFRDALTRYAAWNQERAANREEQAEFARAFLRWLSSGIITTILFIVIAQTRPGELPPVALWSVASALSSPFILAMFRANGVHVAAAFVLRALSLLWLAGLSLEFVPMSVALIVLLAVGAVLSFAFFRQLESTFGWFEQHFLSAFRNEPKTRRPKDFLRHLAPWDAHLSRIKVHPNSEIAGRMLSEATLRTRFGLNVVAIQRGLKAFVAPRPEEMIFPKDELLVLGTDEQVEQAKQIIEQPPGLADRFQSITGYDLKNVRVGEKSPFIGQSLRSLSLREHYGTVVVGLERGSDRILNPDPIQPLASGDVLWLVSDGDRFEKLRAQLDPS